MIYVTQSQIKAYKACKRKYELSYIHGLKPVSKAEALEVGSSYHEKIESLIKKGYFEPTNDKTDAMAYAFEKYVMPKLPKIVESEKEFEKELSEDVTLIGKIDAVCEDGLFVEHKTTSFDLSEDYVYNLGFDDQIPAYMIAGKINNMYYTVCKKPTIRQKKDESTEDYVNRCIKWYDEDTDSKIGMFTVHRSEKELAEKAEEFVKIAREMNSCGF